MNKRTNAISMLCCGVLLWGCSHEEPNALSGADSSSQVKRPVSAPTQFKNASRTSEDSIAPEDALAAESCTCAVGTDHLVSRTDNNVYTIPPVSLTDQRDQQTSSTLLFAHEGPVVVQFFFTSCSTLCPVLTSSLSAMQENLGDEIDRTLIVSISIDPNHDRPEQLLEFAEQFETRAKWQFVTGDEDSIRALQNAFDANQQNKMQHLPLTFIRPNRQSSWTRLNGLLSGEALAQEFLATLATQ